MNLLARQSHFSHSDGVCFHDTQFQRLFFRFRLSAAPPRPFSSEFLSAPTTTSNATPRQLLKPSRDLGCTSRLIHHIGVIPSGCIPTAGCTSRLIHHIGVIPSGCMPADLRLQGGVACRWWAVRTNNLRDTLPRQPPRPSYGQ